MEAHKSAVICLSSRVRSFYDQSKPFRIYHGSTNSTRPSVRRRDQMVDTSNLNNVIQVDAKARFAMVEPNVPMDALVEATLLYGLMPPVVMEFPGITVGGGFAGTAGESSSFRWSFFDRTISWIEMILANGEIMTASKDHNSDLFFGAASSFGTLGITTLLKVDLIEARKFVQLTYQPVTSITEAVTEVQKSVNDPSVDYIDGILFSKTAGVVCSGRLADNADSPSQGFTRATDPWFYLHAERVIERSGRKPMTDSVPLQDYLFRYDRGGFWVGKYAYKYFITPFNGFTRWALDYFMHARVMYHALHKSGLMNENIIQDVAIPYPNAPNFSEYLDNTFGFYPLWICPLSMRGAAVSAPQNILTETVSKGPDALLNFGIWGPGPRNGHAFIKANRGLEHRVSSLNGRKWFYALTYHTEEEFWNIYDREKYNALRAKYHATHLPTIYDKVKVAVEDEERAMHASWVSQLLEMFWSIWPLKGLYGVYKAAIGGEYLLSRENLRPRRLLLSCVMFVSLCFLFSSLLV